MKKGRKRENEERRTGEKEQCSEDNQTKAMKEKKFQKGREELNPVKGILE